MGVTLAIVSCLSCGAMEVLVSACSQVSINQSEHSNSNNILLQCQVSTTVCLLWSAVAGLIISVVYCKLSGSSMILSSEIVNINVSEWLSFVGLSLSGLLAFSCLTLSLQVSI